MWEQLSNNRKATRNDPPEKQARCRAWCVHICLRRLSFLLMLGCFHSLIGCTEETCLDACPPPTVGVVLDTGVVEKSIWFSEDRLGDPGGGRALCAVPIDNVPGDELLFRGEDGVVIITLAEGRPDKTTFMRTAAGEVFKIIDVDQDGNAEYVFFNDQEFRYLDPAGNLIYEANVSAGWTTVDFDRDGLYEFLIISRTGVIVLNADGSERARIGGGLLATRIAEINQGASIVIVTSESFESTSLQIWDADGELLTGLSTADLSNLNSNRGPIGTAVEFDCFGCLDFGFDFDNSGEVQLGSFRAAFSYSRIFTTLFPFGNEITNTHTIVKIADSAGGLVYHEVLASASPPCSFVVLPVDEQGKQTLLLAQNERILAYRIP